MELKTLIKEIYAKLNPFQQSIYHECLQKTNTSTTRLPFILTTTRVSPPNGFGLSLPLGSGKTIISLLLALTSIHDSPPDKKILIVVSKTLLQSWIAEIEKFFKPEWITYQVLHKDAFRLSAAEKKEISSSSTSSSGHLSLWKLKDETKIVLTTADVVGNCYKKTELRNFFVKQVFMPNNGAIYENLYHHPIEPFLNHSIGEGILFSREWGCLLVDEIQKYTNIDTNWCQGIGAICAKQRWGLSGTIFDEPKINNILGFCVILDIEGEPRTVPDMQRRVYKDRTFKGLNPYLIIREKNEAFIPPRVNEEIISHNLLPQEQVVYETLRRSLLRIADEAKKSENLSGFRRIENVK